MPWQGSGEGKPLFIDVHCYRGFRGNNTLLRLPAVLARWQKHEHAGRNMNTLAET